MTIDGKTVKLTSGTGIAVTAANAVGNLIQVTEAGADRKLYSLRESTNETLLLLENGFVGRIVSVITYCVDA